MFRRPCWMPTPQAKDSKKIRAGKGKMRNRRYVMRRGPLVIYDKSEVSLYASAIHEVQALIPGDDLFTSTWYQ